MTHKYGEFSEKQMAEYKEKMRKQIYFLLLIVDPETKSKVDYKNTNVEEAFENVLRTFGGYNELLGCPMPMVTVMSLLNAAHMELHSPDYSFATYRKLILDAGCEVLKIKEV